MIRSSLAILSITISLTGCTTNNATDYSNLPEPRDAVEQVFHDMQPYAVELLDEMRLLSKTRSAKAQAAKPIEQRRQERLLSTVVFPGFDKRISWHCPCEVNTVAKGIAERVGYGADRVFSYGTRPPGGVMVNINLENRPVNDVIKMIDTQVGAQIDFTIDPTHKTIVVKYLETSS